LELGKVGDTDSNPWKLLQTRDIENTMKV
jgi:hypothetical protein